MLVPNRVCPVALALLVGSCGCVSTSRVRAVVASAATESAYVAIIAETTSIRRMSGVLGAHPHVTFEPQAVRIERAVYALEGAPQETERSFLFERPYQPLGDPKELEVARYLPADGARPLFGDWLGDGIVVVRATDDIPAGETMAASEIAALEAAMLHPLSVRVRFVDGTETCYLQFGQWVGNENGPTAVLCGRTVSALSDVHLDYGAILDLPRHRLLAEPRRDPTPSWPVGLPQAFIIWDYRAGTRRTVEIPYES